MPFFRLFWVVAACYMSALESHAHLVNVDILVASIVSFIIDGKMFKEGGHTPKWIIFLKFFELLLVQSVRFNDMESSFECIETITGETFFNEGVGVSEILTPIRPQRRLFLDAHVQNYRKVPI